MNILIIGGCGYLGSRLYQRLFYHHLIDSVDLEWFGNPGVASEKKDYRYLDKRFLRRFDVVIALAGYSSERMCVGVMDGVIENNVANFARLVSNVRKDAKLIFSSSCRVYYGKQHWSRREESLKFSSPHPYDISMYSRELIARGSGIEFYGLRLATVNGFSANFRKDSMINSLVYSATERGYMQAGNVESNRSILDIEDFLNAVEAIVDCPNDKRGIYNVASFNSTVGSIADKAGKFLEVKVVNTGTREINDFSMDTSKFKKTFDFSFMGSVESIISGIQQGYDSMNKTDRKEPRKYVI